MGETETATKIVPNPNHPARYSEPILDLISRLVADETARVGRRLRIIDPFGGVGRIHDVDADTVHGDLELGWAACRRPSVLADATVPPFRRHAFDGYMTSPCLAQRHRLLTDDLRWVAAGDVQCGDRLLTFDENGLPNTNGPRSRRRWERAEVVRSTPRSVKCVRVILENGDEIVTTPNHPWLARRYSYRSEAAKWVTSKNLMGTAERGTGKGHRAGLRHAWYVYLQARPWTERHTFDAGWLSGIFDGEGSLSLSAHGSPKMMFCQVEGAVFDRAVGLMAEFGYQPKLFSHHAPPHRKPVMNAYVAGGFPNLLRALGELRPTRLLNKWTRLDVSTRTIQAELVRVAAVEPAGRRDIQEIETSSGTYIGEGYLMHNSYGSRAADHHNAQDSHKACGGNGCRVCAFSGLSPRKTYRVANGGPLHPRNSGQMPWGERYKDIHRQAWAQIAYLVRPGGLVVVNVSNHIRGGVEQPVTEWHLGQLRRAGLLFEDLYAVPTRRYRNGANRDARVAHEHVIVMRTPAG